MAYSLWLELRDIIDLAAECPMPEPKGEKEIDAWLADGGNTPGAAAQAAFSVEGVICVWTDFACWGGEPLQWAINDLKTTAEAFWKEMKFAKETSKEAKSKLEPGNISAVAVEAQRTAEGKCDRMRRARAVLVSLLRSDTIATKSVPKYLIEFLEHHQFRAPESGPPPKRFRPYLKGNQQLINELKAEGDYPRRGYGFLADLLEQFRLLKNRGRGRPCEPGKGAKKRFAAFDVWFMTYYFGIDRNVAIDRTAPHHGLASYELKRMLDGRDNKKYREHY